MLRKLNVGSGRSDDVAVGNRKGVVYACSDDTMPSYPEDVVNHRHVIVHEELPENIWKGSELQVFVRKVNSPSEFWINLCGLEYSRKLVNLRNNMRKFYEQADDGFLLPQYAVRSGQFCVCMFKNEWHRARIVKTDEKDVNLVDVFLLDCGSTVTVATENLRLMHKTFSHLAIQGFLADLPDIKPKGSATWPTCVCEFFRQETTGQKFRAKLVDLSRERHAVSLKLFDVNGNSISEKLMSNGMAQSATQGIDPPATENKECVDTRNKETVDSKDKESMDSRSKECVHSSVGASPVKLENVVAISEDKSRSSREDWHQENETVSRSTASCRNVGHKYVTIAGKILILVSINDKNYFVLSDFLQAFGLFHEHVVLNLLAVYPTPVAVEKLHIEEVLLLMANLRGRRIRGMCHLMDNGIVPSVNLLPINVAWELLNFLEEDGSRTICVRRFVSTFI